MADELNLGKGLFTFEVNATISGEDKVIGFVKTLNSMTRNNNFAAYWGKQEDMIRNVTNAMDQYTRTASRADASELINTFNALKAVAGDNLPNLFQNFSSVLSTFEDATKRVGHSVINEMSPENFQQAFASFELLQKYGIDTEEIFKRIGTSGEIDTLREQIGELTWSLAGTRQALERVREERDALLNGDEIQRLREVENAYETLVGSMQGEFAAFLKGNNLDDSRWGHFSEYFSEIAQGSMTANEAITKVRTELLALFEAGEAGGASFSSDQVQRFISMLEEACNKIEQMRTEIQAMYDGASIRQATSQLEESAQITERQRDALHQLTQEGSGLSSVEQVLVALVSNFDATGQEASEAAGSIKEFVNALRDIATSGEQNIKGVRQIFDSIGTLKTLDINQDQTKNLVAALKDIAMVVDDLPKLASLTNISLSGFSGLSISKASMSNLATYLPVIASVDTSRLKALSEINLTNFNGIHVTKASLENVKELVNSISNVQSGGAGAPGRDWYASIQSSIQALTQALSAIPTLTAGIASGMAQEASGVSDVNKEMEKHAGAVQTAADAEMQKAGSSEELTNALSGEGDALNKSADSAEKDAEAMRKLSESLSGGEAGVALDDLVSKFEKLKDASQISDSMQKLKEAADILKSDTATDEAKLNAYRTYLQLIDQVTAAVQRQAKAEKSAESAETTRVKLLKELETQLTKTEQLQQKFSNEKFGNHAKEYEELCNLAERLRQKIEEVKNAEGGDSSGLTKIRQELDQIIAKREELRRGFTGTQDGLSMIGSRLVYILSLSNLIMQAVRQIKKMVTTTIELDTAMTQLRVVSNATESDYTAYGQAVTKTAKEISASITDLIDSTTVFARLGYTLDESADLAKYTAMLSRVGDVDISSAQNALTAITKAFDGVDASNIEVAMDKMVTVGNNFPISVAQIAEGMNNAGSSLAAAGNSFEQSIALLTAANTTVQNISKASTGLRTITARIRGTKMELDDLGESIETAKYQEALDVLTKYKVALTENGEYRATYDILKDLSAVWGELSNMEQAAIAEQLAGKRLLLLPGRAETRV